MKPQKMERKGLRRKAERRSYAKLHRALKIANAALFPILPIAWNALRTYSLADEPDEVELEQIYDRDIQTYLPLLAEAAGIDLEEATAAVQRVDRKTRRVVSPGAAGSVPSNPNALGGKAVVI